MVTSAQTVAQAIEEARLNPIRWLVPGILLRDGIHVLHGKEESFKTMLTIQLHEALARGGEFLLQPVEGGLATGIVELEEKPNLFGHRLDRFFGDDPPNIHLLPPHLRASVLGCRTPKDRISIIADWAQRLALAVVSIDSAVKLFPPFCDLSKPELASEVFNCLQNLPTLWLLAHDRKSAAEGGRDAVGNPIRRGNDEIVGSGRFAQDPDVIHQMIRDDARAPRVVLDCGKVREGIKQPRLELWFDAVDFRLHPLHPYIHLLGPEPRAEEDILREAEARYHWRERRARSYLATLLQLKAADRQHVVAESQQGHRKMLRLIGTPVLLDPDDEALMEAGI